jgi:hypothetical protein
MRASGCSFPGGAEAVGELLAVIGEYFWQMVIGTAWIRRFRKPRAEPAD